MRGTAVKIDGSGNQDAVIICMGCHGPFCFILYLRRYRHEPFTFLDKHILKFNNHRLNNIPTYSHLRLLHIDTNSMYHTGGCHGIICADSHMIALSSYKSAYLHNSRCNECISVHSVLSNYNYYQIGI